MPPLAIAGVAAAAIGAGATVLGANKNSKAIKTATQAQTDSSAQQLAFQQQARAENTAALSPLMARGNVAGETINAALGLGGNVPGAQPGQTPAQSAASAYDLFKQSTGYQNRFSEGQRALNSGFAARGLSQSGAAQKAALRYGDNMASNEYSSWMNLLGNQQQLGFGGASALAGVSQNFANNASNISQNGATFAGQAAVAGAQNTGALYTGLAGIAGNTLGALSSYGKTNYSPTYGIANPNASAGWYDPRVTF